MKFKITIIALFFFKVSFAQMEYQVYGYEFLTPIQKEKWIIQNDISKIFVLHFSPNDTINQTGIDEYRFDKRGYVISKGIGNKKSWNNCDTFKFDNEVKYQYENYDSLLFVSKQLIRHIAHKVKINNIDTIFKADTSQLKREFWNVNNLRHFIAENNSYNYSYDSVMRIKQIIRENLGIKAGNKILKSKTINDFVYKDSKLIMISSETSGMGTIINGHSTKSRKLKFLYDKHNNISESKEYWGDHENIKYKYYYNENHFLVKKETYLNSALILITKYVYGCR